MRGILLGVLLVAIPFAMAGAEPPDMRAREAIALIRNAKQNGTEGYSYRAEAQYRRALAILEETSGPRSPDLTPALNGLADLYFEARHYTEAEAMARRSAAVVEAGLGDGHPLLATALQDLAAIYHVQGQYAKAEPLYYRALAIREKALGPNHAFVAATLADLAEMESAQGHYDRAAEHYARAVQIRQDAFGMDDPRVAQTLAGYAAVLRRASCARRHRQSASMPRGGGTAKGRRGDPSSEK
jgi:tetratricopeptide (TPR) repeat protein